MATTRISIIGTGYVGSVTGACLAKMGHEVVFVDTDKEKLRRVANGQSPVYEPGLEAILRKCRKNISVTPDLNEAVKGTGITFICVGTPQKKDGSCNLGQVRAVAKKLGRSLRSIDRYHVIVTKSTVPPSTGESVILPILEKESGKKAFLDFGLASNPEFLREGTAVSDFFRTDRVVIGARDEKTTRIMKKIYRPLGVTVFVTTIPAAEMIKYTSNAFLATKISFANEIGNLCKELGIDSYEVFKGTGLDERIGPLFFRSGIGFGGSCFPKDVRALIASFESNGLKPRILSSVVAVNSDQPGRMIALLKKHIDPKGRCIGILGLSFKPDTDDVRESRAIPVIRMLLKSGAKVKAYDPAAMENFRKLFPGIEYSGSAWEVLDADAICIVTEWDEFGRLDYRGRLVIDGRRIENARTGAAVYEGVCW